MADHVPAGVRSAMISKVKGRNTTPELACGVRCSPQGFAFVCTGPTCPVVVVRKGLRDSGLAPRNRADLADVEMSEPPVAAALLRVADPGPA